MLNSLITALDARFDRNWVTYYYLPGLFFTGLFVIVGAYPDDPGRQVDQFLTRPPATVALGTLGFFVVTIAIGIFLAVLSRSLLRFLQGYNLSPKGRKATFFTNKALRLRARQRWLSAEIDDLKGVLEKDFEAYLAASDPPPRNEAQKQAAIDEHEEAIKEARDIFEAAIAKLQNQDEDAVRDLDSQLAASIKRADDKRDADVKKAEADEEAAQATQVENQAKAKTDFEEHKSELESHRSEELKIANLIFLECPATGSMPTRLGNVLRAAEAYGIDRYGFDTVMLWPVLETALSADHAKKLQEARINLDLWALLWALSLTFSSIAPFVLAWRDAPDLLIGISAIGILLSFLCYSAAVNAGIQYGIVLRSAVDLFRWDVLDKLKIDPPKDFAHEKETWQEVSNLIFRGGGLSKARYQLPGVPLTDPPFDPTPPQPEEPFIPGENPSTKDTPLQFLRHLLTPAIFLVVGVASIAAKPWLGASDKDATYNFPLAANVASAQGPTTAGEKVAVLVTPPDEPAIEFPDLEVAQPPLAEGDPLLLKVDLATSQRLASLLGAATAPKVHVIEKHVDPKPGDKPIPPPRYIFPLDLPHKPIPALAKGEEITVVASSTTGSVEFPNAEVVETHALPKDAKAPAMEPTRLLLILDLPSAKKLAALLAPATPAKIHLIRQSP